MSCVSPGEEAALESTLPSAVRDREQRGRPGSRVTPTCGGGMAGARVSGSIFQRGGASAASESEQDSQVQSPELDDRRVRRREKNRVAAQRSRKKQTQRADSLHKEYECLEQENSALKREVGRLAEEVKRLGEVLKAHEQICPLLHHPVNLVTMPRATDAIANGLPR